MDVVLYIIALLLAVAGVVGAVVPVIPGTIVSFLALLMSYFTNQPATTTTGLMICLVVSVVIYVIDMLLPVYLTKRFGGSKSGVWGATIGMIVGFIAFPPLGVFVGPIFGAVMGELLNDKDDLNRALKVGAASFLAFLVGTGLKFALSVYIFWLIILSQRSTVDAMVEWAKSLF